MRKAFTLIELMVVMAIIAVLMALLLVGIRGVADTGKRTQAATECRELETAAGLYKAKFGVPVWVGDFRIATTYTGVSLNWPEVRYLKECWPNIDLNDTGYRNQGIPTQTVDWTVAHVLNDRQAVTFFLTGGLFSNFQGFSTNPRRPFTAPTATDKRIGPFIQGQNNTQFQQDGLFRDPWKTPYNFMMVGSQLQVMSAGKDRAFGTEDDVK